MSIRDLKKEIEYLIAAFVDDCTLFLSANPDRQTGKVPALIDEAVTLFNDLRDKAGKPEGIKKTFYNGLRKELTDKLDALYDELSKAVKEEVKGE